MYFSVLPLKLVCNIIRTCWPFLIYTGIELEDAEVHCHQVASPLPTSQTSTALNKVSTPQKRKKKSAPTIAASPQPGPSGYHVSSSSEEEIEEEVREEELCCVCKRFQPKELKDAASLFFIEWAQCATCNHWTHLIYCSNVQFVRREDTFLCPHCIQ